MLAKITNFGPARTFPIPDGYLTVPPYTPMRIRNPKTIETLQKFNKRDDVFLKIEILEPDADYSKYRIWELRAIASKVGIPGSFRMRKPELVARLSREAR